MTIVITKQLLVGVIVGCSMGFVFGAVIGYAAGLKDRQRHGKGPMD